MTSILATQNGHTKVYDVIVVGAGLSGLQAAVTAYQAGLSVLVLEATDRIGGKVESVPNVPGSKETVDTGAAWINDTSQSYMFALGQKYGAKFGKQNVEGDSLFQTPDGKVLKLPRGVLPAPEEDQHRLFEFVGQIDEIGKQIEAENFHGPLSKELDQITFKTWVKEQGGSLELAESLSIFLVRALVGAELDEVSALYVLKYINLGTGLQNISGAEKDGGQYLRPYQGSRIYIKGLASELPPNTIQTSAPVSSITQPTTTSAYSTVTTTTSQTHHAKKVIISIPTPLYKHITFIPPLPTAKQTLSTSTTLGYYSKLIATYPHPWWRPTLSGETQIFHPTPISMIIDTSIPATSQFSLSMFIIGTPGRKWSRLSKLDRQNAALAHLYQLFSPWIEDVPEPSNLIEKEWSKEPWFEGAPSSLYGVGLLTSEAGETLREKVGAIHFCGTEMATVWEDYTEGAVRDGERAALEVVKLLRGEE